MQIGMNEFDHHILALLKQQRERSENSGLNRDSNADLSDTSPAIRPTGSRSLCGPIISSYRCGNK